MKFTPNVLFCFIVGICLRCACVMHLNESIKKLEPVFLKITEIIYLQKMNDERHMWPCRLCSSSIKINHLMQKSGYIPSIYNTRNTDYLRKCIKKLEYLLVLLLCFSLYFVYQHTFFNILCVDVMLTSVACEYFHGFIEMKLSVFFLFLFSLPIYRFIDQWPKSLIKRLHSITH